MLVSGDKAAVEFAGVPKKWIKECKVSTEE